MWTNYRSLRQTTTNSLLSVVLQCTLQGFSANNAMMNDMMDALQLQPLRQKFPATNEDPVRRNKALIKFRTLLRHVETEFIMWVALAGGD